MATNYLVAVVQLSFKSRIETSFDLCPLRPLCKSSSASRSSDKRKEFDDSKWDEVDDAIASNAYKDETVRATSWQYFFFHRHLLASDNRE